MGIKKIKGKMKSFFSLQEVKDWAISFLVAAVFYFIILPAVLGTSSPAVVVSSCSEKGYLNIGDILILQGVRIEDINAPLVEVDKYEGFTPIFEKEEVTKLNISGKIVELNRSSDIIVYLANPTNMQIIHRVFVKIKTQKGYLLITKGDANNFPDQMTPKGGQCIDRNVGCISTPITQERIVGRKILFQIPLLGNIKLFFCDLFFGKLCEGHANAGTDYEYKLWC
jgi:signal peptidase I